jgi:hypothetical protein
MVSSVRQRPNHYETLGLTPAASDDEVAKAFARKMNAFRWHPAGAAAQVWIAYETLRDRIRRADYDRALGLAPKPKREWTMAVTREQWTPLIAPAPVQVAREPARKPDPRAEPPVDPRLESIAATLRELSRPATPRKSPEPASEPREHWRPDDGVEPLIERILAVDHAEKARLHAREVRSPGWRKPALAVGGLLFGAGLIGAYAGLSVSDHEGSAQAESAAKPPKQATRRQAAAAVPQSAPAPITFEPLAQPFVRDAAEHSKSKHRVLRQQVKQAEPVVSDAAASQSESTVNDPPAADPLAPQPVASASLPIANNVVARTIDRIGYSCGQVSSSVPVEGSPGTFSVTCSSGQSFRATRVHGRYHFRRAR